MRSLGESATCSGAAAGGCWGVGSDCEVEVEEEVARVGAAEEEEEGEGEAAWMMTRGKWSPLPHPADQTLLLRHAPVVIAVRTLRLVCQL